MAAATIALVLLFNRRAWLLAVAAIAGGVWYEVLITVAHRARPTADQVLRITERPGSTSFPSGHVIFLTIDLAVLMLCIGHRYLPTWANRTGWSASARSSAVRSTWGSPSSTWPTTTALRTARPRKTSAGSSRPTWPATAMSS